MNGAEASGADVSAIRREPWLRPMTARRRDEPHRAATPLELLFDLCFVVAVGQAAAGLHHAAIEGHFRDGLFGFALVFFAIWWAWMNFTWFASAFDTDDVPYRITTMVQIAGGLVLAAGVPRAFEDDLSVVTWGYVVMRLALVSQWTRVAFSDRSSRPAALRFAVGVTLVQIGWVLRLLLPPQLFLPGVLVLIAADLLVPVWAERAAPTSWHPEHIAERYGLFTIIVLGESVFASTASVRSGIRSGGEVGPLLLIAACGLVLVFALWWLYFGWPAAERLTSLPRGLVWGYGHYVIFSSAAAVGAGLEVAADHELGRAHIGMRPAALTLTIPVALFLLSVWLLHIGPTHPARSVAVAFPVAALMVVLASVTPFAVELTAAVTAGLVVVVVVTRTARPSSEGLRRAGSRRPGQR